MSDYVKDIGPHEFDSNVIQATGLVLVDFWAPWCGPCRMVGPVLEEIAGEMKDSITVYKVNVDNFGDLAQKYGVSGIPTFILFKDGKVVDRNVGAVPKHAIETLVRKHA